MSKTFLVAGLRLWESVYSGKSINTTLLIHEAETLTADRDRWQSVATLLADALELWKNFPHAHMQGCDECYQHHWNKAVPATDAALSAFHTAKGE